MVVLLYGLVVAVDCSFGDGVHVVAVVQSIVSEVVTRRCDDHRELVQFLQIYYIRQPPRCHQEVTHLHHIRSMQVIVVRKVLEVRLNDLFHKVAHLIKRKCPKRVGPLIQIHIVNRFKSQCRKNFLAWYVFLKLKNVELQTLEFLHVFIVICEEAGAASADEGLLVL